MLVNQITASSIKRALACGASHVLPQVIESGEYAEKGHDLHDFLDLCIRGQRKEALEKYKDSEHISEMQALPVTEMMKGVTGIGHDGIATEVTYGVNVNTGEAICIGNHLNRKYPKEDGWVYGSEDVIGRVGGVLYANDWKSGDHVGEVSDNLQVGFFAYCLHKIFKEPRVLGRITYTRDPWFFEEHLFDEGQMEFDIFLSKLRLAYQNVEQAQKIVDSGRMPAVYPNDECKYCAARASCPKWSAMIRTFMSDVSVVDWAATLTPEKIAAIWPKYRQLKRGFDEADEAIRNFVNSCEEEIQLENGKVLGKVEMSKSYIDSKRAIGLARLYGATEQELQSCVKEIKVKQVREIKKNGK